jgi:hypothetical protein
MLRDIGGEALSEGWVKERAEFHRYEGLDVSYIRRHWNHLAQSGLFPAVGGGAVKKWVASELARNIREIVIIGLVFGNVTDNNFHKRSEESQKFVNEILTRCHIVQHVEDTTKRTAVTINRTMIAFAVETVSIAYFLGRDFDAGPGTALLKTLPNMMKTTVFLSVCPTFEKTEVGIFLCRVFTIWSANMNLVINRKGPTRRKRSFTEAEYKESYTAQYEFSEIAYASNAYEGERMKVQLSAWAFGSAATFGILSKVYDADKAKLGLPDIDITVQDWAMAWA